MTRSDSLIKMHVNDHRGKLLMCATTHPINHATRELVLEKHPDLGLHIGDDHFKDYGGNMKAWFNDYSVPNHWVGMLQRKRVPYLREYAPPRVEAFEGKVIQAPGIISNPSHSTLYCLIFSYRIFSYLLPLPTHYYHNLPSPTAHSFPNLI